ncbi:MAG: hypothetical protein CSA68_10125 [Rhodobacterales bacterium]|nr:MAG: hypothetical protein CSA68_10125 [Rhodobacterales bacterium]
MNKVMGFVLAGFALAGCVVEQDKTVQAGPVPTQAVSVYDTLPVLSRKTFEVHIIGKLERCHGMMGRRFDCFVGTTKSGDRIVFNQGIEGYQFKPGRSETIRVQQVKYDFSKDNAPTDIPSIRYFLRP